MIQTGNIRFLEEFEKFQLYGYLGYGTISYKSTLKNSNNPSKNNFVHENSQVIPVGIGIKYHLKENVTLNLEYSMNNINGDKLDAFKDRYTENDSYSKIQFGISYTFGKDYHTELEWHDPRPRQTIQTNRRDTVVVIQKIMVPDTTKNNTLIDASNETIEDSSSINNYENVKTIIYYDFNKYELTDSSVSLLNDFVSNYKKLNENNNGINYIVTIESFTDKIGSEKNNKIVVNRRATEVKNFLINSGIDTKSLDIILHGNQAAISGNDAEDRKTIVHVNKF
jgi:outer membrane protein OmpA-like peptidoglycan-associated protein